MVNENRVHDFQLGVVHVGCRARKAVKGGELAEVLSRHASGDLGDFAGTEQAERNGPEPERGPLISAFRTRQGHRLWIITDRQSCSTLVVLAEEY